MAVSAKAAFCQGKLFVFLYHYQSPFHKIHLNSQSDYVILVLHYKSITFGNKSDTE